MKDIFARVTGGISLVLAVISLAWGIGTYIYDHDRGPELIGSPGKYVYIQGRPRIGVPMGFFNKGASPAIINTSDMALNDGSNEFSFRLTLFSSSTEKWTYDSGTKNSLPVALSLFSQIVTKPGDATEGVFWYSPDLADFKFQPGKKYKASLKFSDRKQSKSGVTQNELSSSIIEFNLDSITANNAAQHPEVINPVETQ